MQEAYKVMSALEKKKLYKKSIVYMINLYVAREVCQNKKSTVMNV